jgi:hypothetical protein
MDVANRPIEPLCQLSIVETDSTIMRKGKRADKHKRIKPETVAEKGAKCKMKEFGTQTLIALRWKDKLKSRNCRRDAERKNPCFWDGRDRRIDA